MPDPAPNDYAWVRSEDHSHDVDAIWPEGDPVVAMAQVYLQFLLFQFGTRAFTPSAFGPSAHDLPCSYAQCLCYKTKSWDVMGFEYIVASIFKPWHDPIFSAGSIPMAPWHSLECAIFAMQVASNPRKSEIMVM
jgi:hypothetical protein